MVTYSVTSVKIISNPVVREKLVNLKLSIMRKQHLLICSCHSTDHQIVIYKESDPLYGPECYVHIHLVRRSFWYRLKYAIKYIFGYKSCYGAWDEFILEPKHIAALEDVINHLQTNETERITV